MIPEVMRELFSTGKSDRLPNGYLSGEGDEGERPGEVVMFHGCEFGDLE